MPGYLREAASGSSHVKALGLVGGAQVAHLEDGLDQGAHVVGRRIFLLPGTGRSNASTVRLTSSLTMRTLVSASSGASSDDPARVERRPADVGLCCALRQGHPGSGQHQNRCRAKAQTRDRFHGLLLAGHPQWPNARVSPLYRQ